VDHCVGETKSIGIGLDDDERKMDIQRVWRYQQQQSHPHFLE
jgi:hypothetical protein